MVRRTLDEQEGVFFLFVLGFFLKISYDILWSIMWLFY